MFKDYKNSSSGIIAYKIEPHQITLKFKSNPRKEYVYTEKNIGTENLAYMKQLAEEGSGLNSFINENSEVKYGYS